jgi:two-component system sensor histidine kinase PilS (NtrC family)
MEIRRKDLFWFIILRLVIITSLAVSVVFIQYGTSAFFEVSPLLSHLYYFILIVYGISALYFLLYWWNRFLTAQVYLQIFIDLFFITYMVYISGGLRGSFYFLYIFEIIAASVVLSNRAAYLTAALSCIFFGVLVDATYFGFIPYFSPEGERITLAMLLNNIVLAWGVFFLVAFLINSLMGNLRKTKEKLTLAQRELEIKKHLAMAGEFAAQLAHEIRNPLAAVSGSVQVLKDSLDLPGNQQALMHIVVDESERVSQSIEQFLNLASPGKHVFTTVKLSDTLQETLLLLQRGGELDEDIRLEGNFANSKIEYYGNKNQFKQIFWNIIKNGIKAMPEGGTMTIHFLRKENGGIRMIFSDTGYGMPEEEKEKIFEPFHSGFTQGSGIGMTVVRRIVEEYGGHIKVETQQGKGTRVMIELPEMKAYDEQGKG